MKLKLILAGNSGVHRERPKLTLSMISLNSEAILHKCTNLICLLPGVRAILHVSTIEAKFGGN